MTTGKTKTDILSKQIAQMVLEYSSPKRIYLFGSRASGENRYNSDIDIAIDGTAVPKRVQRKIRESVKDIRTLLKVDLVWLAEVKEDFRREILRSGRIIYEKN